MRRLFLPLAVIILLAAAVLRIAQLHQYPPGPHYDEAANILITRSIAFGGANLFPITDSYQGRESLYFYLNALLFQFIADDILTFRISSAFINLITIAASMALGRAMFRGNRGIIIGLAVGVLMALSFHQIFMGRQAYRAVTLPMMQALALLFLWRGLNTKRGGWIWLTAAGFFAGGALYTYMASRLFPLWLALGGLALPILDRRNLRLRLQQGAVFFGVMAFTLMPLAVYAFQRPDVFFQRLDEVSEGEITITLLESIQRHAEMFFIRGDFGNLRYNIPGRPYFTLPEGILMLVGIGAALWRLFRHGSPTERAAYFLALLSPLMVIPSVISLAGFPPSHMRSLGMVPLIFVLVAIGFEAVFRRFNARFRQLQPRYTLTALTIFTLLIGGFLVGSGYFDWARRADLFYQADGDLAQAVRWLPSQVDDNTLVYIAAFHREHPTIISRWDHPVTWLGTDSLFLPPPDQEALVIFAHDTPPPPDWEALLSSAQRLSVPPGPDGEPAFHAYRITAEAELMALEQPESPVRNPLLALNGIYGDPAPAGETAEVVMVWQVDQPPPYYRLRPILDLRNADNVSLASTDAYLLGTDQWRAGEVMLHRMQFPVPPGTPPGDYPITVTWVDRDTGTYLSYVNEEGAHAGVTATIGHLQVTRPATFPSADVLPAAIRHPVAAAPGVQLVGWYPPAASVRPGQVLTPVLFWQALPVIAERDTLPLHAVLRGASTGADTLIWQGQPAHSPTEWIDGELVTEYMHWTVPHEQPAGEYALILETPAQEIELGTIQIDGLPRLFDPPPVETLLQTPLGESLSLYGYTLKVEDNIQLELVWTSRQQVTEDYTVFVHLVDSNGLIVAQHDMMPVANTYPTSLWIIREYVIDQYVFNGILPGVYHLRIGFYLQSSGTRLHILNPDGTLEGDYINIDTIIVET